ncbi:glycosyltransferase family 87 protein [Actinomadura algeriensis]|uniref:Membrane protein n=1 Tax=Actinomadura algeriensis TaxID=1679523 RepID=A0ABR9JP64_9ACTN|nr:glycosyltransferase 87 family protein [Actinomadura algeriensis]MBE1532354.1 putative membrane protein [Actinomadura algeriensis]
MSSSSERLVKPDAEAADARGRMARLVPVLTGVTALVCLLGWLQKRPCASAGFDFIKTTTNACYTDVYPLYYVRGLNDGLLPYFDSFPGTDIRFVEYPVLSGGFMQLVAWMVGPFDDDGRGMAFYNVTVLLLAVCAVVTVLATAYTAGRRSLRTGLMVALSPALLLSAYINWDLLAVGLSALALAAWSKRRPALAGVLLGLAIAAKFYPLLFLGPLVLLCVRAGRWRAMGRMLAGTAVAWLAVNLPVMVFAWDGWLQFYTFSQERGIDWGSIWFFLRDQGMPGLDDTDRLNLLGTGTTFVLCAGIAVLALAAPRRPRLSQLMFLVLVAFMLPNKVWSPQYVLWLLPLAVLARPKLPAFVAWQIGEIVYFFGIWWFLLSVSAQTPGEDLSGTLSAVLSLNAPEGGVNQDVYNIALLARFVTVLVLAALIVWDVLRPSGDSVRSDGTDDPAGGFLDGADDVVSLGRWRAARRTVRAGAAPAVP